MVLIKANVSRLKPDPLVAKASFVVSQMTGNAAFPQPTPKLTDITAAKDQLVADLDTAVSGAHEAVGQKNISAKNLRTLLSGLAKYVNSASGTDLSVALTSGFEAAKGHEPIVILNAPTDLVGKKGKYEMSVELRWKKVEGARMYTVYMLDTTGPIPVWKSIAIVTRTSHQVAGLATGSEHTFRVTALGAAGESPASEAATAKAA